MTEPDLAAMTDLAATSGDFVRGALAQRALYVLIDYKTWTGLTAAQRSWIGPLTQAHARGVLDCETCITHLSDPATPPAWVCSECRQQWATI